MSGHRGAAAEIPEQFPPTLREVMLRPRWLGLLAVCLVIAGVFAWLGQWQLSRAVVTEQVAPGATEAVRPLTEVIGPGEYGTVPIDGQRVSVTGTMAPYDYIVVASRYNGSEEGFWLTGQFRLSESTERTSIAVALGWASTEAEVEAVIQSLEGIAAFTDPAPVELTGRLISDEGAVLPPSGADPFTLVRMSPAALLSRWSETEELEVYRQFVVSDQAPTGLIDIDSPAPPTASGVNWLNLFYAAEWAIFAGFAFYLWYRLAKDAWERETEEAHAAPA